MLKEAQAMQCWLTQVRRQLHRCPGTGFDLAETVRLVKDTLTELGYEPRDCGKAGVVAEIGHGKKTFLLRADMDGLPIREETGLDFAAENGNMHACGHDLHTAMLLGAAKLLKAHEHRLQGTVRLMFQPAEETLEGAKDMIDHGVLDHVDAAMMVHVMPLPVGAVLVSPAGITAPAADYFQISVQGKGCHGSMPHTGVDALTAAAHILLALQEIPARELSISDRAVLTIGALHGGTAANAIAHTATLDGTLRAYGDDLRGVMRERIRHISHAVASAYRASAEVCFGSGCPSLSNNEALSHAVRGYVTELLGEQRLPAISGGGSEDFAYVSREVPALMAAVGTGVTEYPLHHPKAYFDEQALPIGSAVYAYSAIRWLSEARQH